MSEEEIYSTFQGEWCKSHNIYLVAKSSAANFVEHVLSKNIGILGIDGFILESDGSVESPIKSITDFKRAICTVIKKLHDEIQ